MVCSLSCDVSARWRRILSWMFVCCCSCVAGGGTPGHTLIQTRPICLKVDRRSRPSPVRDRLPLRTLSCGGSVARGVKFVCGDLSKFRAQKLCRTWKLVLCVSLVMLCVLMLKLTCIALGSPGARSF